MIQFLQSIPRASILLILLVSTCFTDVLAQGKSVSGTVKSEGDVIPGATVLEKGTTNGTVTDSDGKFTIAVGEGATLVISFIGMKTKEVEVGNQTTLDVSLESDIAQLSEVVVVGYATVERRDLTSSVSSINAKQLKDIPINSAAQALAGRLAGVQVVTSEGSPNAQVQIRVRGGGSITGDNSPIYVVDGVQVDNALSVIAPQDIESIDVLKDASATAIYGARGANGVVIITTKGGHEMKTTVSYNGLVGVKQLANELPVMNPYDFVSYQYQRAQNIGGTEQSNFLKNYGSFGDLDLYKNVPMVDWQKKVLGRNAVMQTHNVSVTGGTATTQFNVSVSSNTEQGTMLGSDFDRKLVNSRFDHKINDKVRAGFNVRYNHTVVNGAGTSNASSSASNNLRQSVRYQPFLFPGQTENSYDANYAQETNSNSLSLVNPILLSQAQYQKDATDVANLNGYVSIDPTKYINFRSTVGIDLTSERIDNFYDTITNNAKQNGSGQPIASITNMNKSILNNSNVVTISASKLSPTFGKSNKLDLLLGEEIYQTITTANYLESHKFPIGITAERAIGNMALGTPTVPTSSSVTSRLLSFFGRVSYAHKDKYLASFTGRADGSSKFAEGKRWGYFPSASVAWRLTGEDFMQGVRQTVNDLKLRVSYGMAGNNRINDFLYLTQFTPSTYYSSGSNLATGYGPAALSNENLRWETTTSRNIGVDAGFLENKIQLSVDFYRNTTDHLLLNVPVPTTSGYLTQQQNIGKTSNKGIEIQLSGTPVYTGSFRWNVSFNLSFNRNKVESLGTQNSFLVNSGWGGTNAPFDYVVATGKPVGSIWGLVSDGYYKVDDFDYANGVYTLKAGVANDKSITGLNPQPGIIKFKDRTGEGTVDDKDRTIIGNANPKFFGGLNNQFSYKNFDMSVFINFQYGNQVLNANKLEFTNGYTTSANLLSVMNNRWKNIDAEGNIVTDPTALKAMNANASLWMPVTTASSFYASSWAVEKASFVRINNITLGYTLPTSLLSKAKINRFRIYATTNNLKVFTNYSGYDPDVNTRRATPTTPGVDYAAYPRSHTYIFGVNMTF